MKNLLFIGLALFLFSCKKNTEEILNNDLRNQINASIKEVKANLEEFTTLKKEGKIISNFKSTSDQLFEFIENKQKASNFPMSFDKPASFINRNTQILTEASFSTAQTSSTGFDFSEYFFVPRADVGSNLEDYITTFESEIDQLATNANVENLTEQQLIDSLTETTKGIKDEISQTTTLSNEEKQIMLGVFDGIETLTPSIIDYYRSDGATNNFSLNELKTLGSGCNNFFCKIGRALIRVEVAVAVVAAIATIPIGAIALASTAAKFKFLAVWSKFMFKGIELGKIIGISAKLKAGLIGGLYFGIKNAEKGWEKDWRGWPEEFTLGVYAKAES
jgi:hypothetical protein